MPAPVPGLPGVVEVDDPDERPVLQLLRGEGVGRELHVLRQRGEVDRQRRLVLVPGPVEVERAAPEDAHAGGGEAQALQEREGVQVGVPDLDEGGAVGEVEAGQGVAEVTEVRERSLFVFKVKGRSCHTQGCCQCRSCPT